MTANHLPAGKSSSHIAESIALCELQHPIIHRGLHYWEQLRQQREVPARSDISPRALAPLLANITLVKVIGEGDDFELRIAGDAVTRAFRFPVHGQRLSRLSALVPKISHLLRRQYREVVRTRTPQGWRYTIDDSVEVVTFTGAEYLMLPLSEDGQTIDHVLGVTGFLR